MSTDKFTLHRTDRVDHSVFTRHRTKVGLLLVAEASSLGWPTLPAYIVVVGRREEVTFVLEKVDRAEHDNEVEGWRYKSARYPGVSLYLFND